MKNYKKIGLYILLSALYLFIFGSIFGYTNFDIHYNDWCFLKYNYADYHDINLNYMRFWAFLNDPASIPYYKDTIFPYSGSLIYIDYVPIIALPLKIFYRYILRSDAIINIQYSWLFGAFCFILQGLLSYKIIKKITNTPDINAILCSLFFVTAPPLIYRFPFQFTMCAQFLILLSFLPFIFKFSKKQLLIFFFALGFLSCGIFIYFVPILFIIVIAFAIYKYFREKAKIFSCFSHILIYIFGSIISFIIFHGLNSSDLSAQGSGFGIYTTNLNAFINPINIYSAFQSDLFPYLNDLILYSEAQNEGFAYLGGGVIVLIIFSFIYLFKKYKVSEVILYLKKYKLEFIILISVICIFFLISTLPKITLNNKLLFELNVPSKIKDILSLFRANSRFIWVNFYLVYFIIFIFLIKNFKRQMLTLILMLGLSLQMFDMAYSTRLLRCEYSKKQIYKNPLDNNYVWSNLKQGKDKIVIFCYHAFDYIDFAQYAIKNKMKMNNLHWGRDIEYSKYYDYLNKVYTEPQDDILYVFSQDDLLYIKHKTNLKNCYTLYNEYIACTKENNKKLEAIKMPNANFPNSKKYADKSLAYKYFLEYILEKK